MHLAFPRARLVPAAAIALLALARPLPARASVVPKLDDPMVGMQSIDAGPDDDEGDPLDASDAGPAGSAEVDGGAPGAREPSPSDAGFEALTVPSRAIPFAPPGPPGIPRARLSPLEPPTQAELDDRAGLMNSRCNPRWGAVYPGLGALCAGRDTEAEWLLGIGTLELGTGLAVGFSQGFGATGAELPLLGFGDLFTAVSIDASLRVERARRLPYVPEDSLAEDYSAPFRLDVLRQPDVYLGIIGLVGVGVLFEQYLDGPIPDTSYGQRPVLFGHNVNSSVAYPLSTAIGVGLFTQVATAEEIAFRGMIQSRLTRAYGELPGWLEGSLIFGLFHASNILFMPANERVDYLTHGVPFITIVGSYLGFTYMRHGYSLGPSIAVHFWYDFLIEGISFILDPKNSPLAFSYAF